MDSLESSKKDKIPLEGCTLVSRTEERGMVHDKFQIEPGEYNAFFGFRRFGEHELDWFAGASDNSKDRDEAFILDHQSPLVLNFADELFEGDASFDDPVKFRALTERFNRMITSAPLGEHEDHQSLSDIIQKGRGTCAAKSVLFGSLAARTTNLSLQDISGQYGVVREHVSYPFGHTWIRAEGSKHIFLFDPMYEKLAAFEKVQDDIYNLDSESDTFAIYTPGFFPAGKFITDMNLTRFSGVHLARPYEPDGTYEPYVPSEEALFAQLRGGMDFSFAIDSDSAEFDLYDGSIRTQRSDTARMYFPLKGIRALT